MLSAAARASRWLEGAARTPAAVKARTDSTEAYMTRDVKCEERGMRNEKGVRRHILYSLRALTRSTAGCHVPARLGAHGQSKAQSAWII